MKKLLVAFFLFALVLPGLGSAQGQSYFGKTTVNTGNLDIAVQSFRNEVAAVALENRSDTPVLCNVTFSNGAQFAETRRAGVNPGKRITVAYRVRAIAAKVDMDVRCASRKQG